MHRRRERVSVGANLREPMNSLNRTRLIALLACSTAPAAAAQQNFLPGFSGLKDGSQAPVGMYVAALGWGFNTSTVVDKNGTSHSLTNGGATSTLVGASFLAVTKLTLLGGNYGFAVMAPWISNRLDIPRIDVSSNGGWGYTSTYVQPINLGWHAKRADYMVGYAVYLPTGAWSFAGNNNFGLGMWTQEISAGSTLYLNEKKSLAFALQAVYDINSAKKDTTYQTGNPLTLQGGLSLDYGDPKKLLSGWLGVAGFAQWIVKATSYGVSVGPIDKTIDGPYGQKYGLGPELVTMQGALTVRYIWEFGAKSAFQGNLWFVAFGLPI